MADSPIIPSNTQQTFSTESLQPQVVLTRSMSRFLRLTSGSGRLPKVVKKVLQLLFEQEPNTLSPREKL